MPRKSRAAPPRFRPRVRPQAAGRRRTRGGADLHHRAGRIRYFDCHHSADGTLAVVARAQLNRNVATWAYLLYLVADSGVDFRRSRILGGREWVRLGAVELGLDCLRRQLQGLPVVERIDFERT